MFSSPWSSLEHKQSQVKFTYTQLILVMGNFCHYRSETGFQQYNRGKPPWGDNSEQWRCPNSVDEGEQCALINHFDQPLGTYLLSKLTWQLQLTNVTSLSKIDKLISMICFQLLVSVPGYDAVLERLPYMEVKLSELLNDIRVVRHERSHSQVRFILS